MPVPILASKLLTQAGFAHAFSTRQGGVSPAPFDALDFATARDAAALQENVVRLAETVGFDPARLHQAKQVHGINVIQAGEDPSLTLMLEADAVVAAGGSHHAVAVRIADCVPVLIGDQATGGVAAIHAGWRGIVAGVIGATVGRFEAGRLIAAIGPCIGPCCFEVGVDVADQISGASSDDAIDRRVLGERDREGGGRGADKVFVDLRRAVRVQLRALGLPDDAIEDVPSAGRSGCTRCNPEKFYSHRRDGDSAGRLVGVIVAR